MAAKIGQILLDCKLITEDQLEKALELQRKEGGRITSNLIKLGFVSEEDIVNFLSKLCGVPVIAESEFIVDCSFAKYIPYKVAKNYQIFPISKDGASLKLAMTDPSNVFAIDDVKFMTGYDVAPVVASESIIEKAISECYSTSDSDYHSIVDSMACFDLSDDITSDDESNSQNNNTNSNEESIDQLLQKEIDKLTLGTLLFNIPHVMRIGVRERIEVRIAKNFTEGINLNLKGRGVPELEQIKIGTFMKVRLSGESFEINKLNEEEQIILQDSYTEWAWDVLPTKTGEQFLHLHITIRVKIPNIEEKKDYPVIDNKVQVQVNTLYSVKQFAIKYWKWLLTTIVIPFIYWIVKEYIQK